MSTKPVPPTILKQAFYDTPPTKPRLSLRKVIDRIAEFLESNSIYWAGIELETIDHNGCLSPGSSELAPAGKALRIYVTDPEEPDGIEKVEFVKIQCDTETLASPREKNQRRDSEGKD